MSTKEHKKKVFQKTLELFPKYKNIFIADVKDIAANFIQKIRHELVKLGSTDTLCGKTTVVQKAIAEYLKDNEKKLPKHLPKDKLKELSDAMPGIHLLLIFSNKREIFIPFLALASTKYKLFEAAKFSALVNQL